MRLHRIVRVAAALALTIACAFPDHRSAQAGTLGTRQES